MVKISWRRPMQLIKYFAGTLRGRIFARTYCPVVEKILFMNTIFANQLFSKVLGGFIFTNQK